VTFFAADEKGERGEPIELPTEAYELNPARGTLTYDLNLFPENPAYVVGSIPLFLATIEKGEIDVTKLPKGLSLKDNALVVDQKEFPADSWRFYAKNVDPQHLMWYVIIHMTFVVSAFAMGYLDKLTKH
jgi:hypothetical protein